jgi:hypothetical protein
MPKLRVVEGKLSSKYNHFADYDFAECTATNTRLMGVVALRIRWVSREDDDDQLIQMMHLDFSEYGIDDYKEIFTKKYTQEGGVEVSRVWKHMAGSLGGTPVKLSLAAAVSLIDESMARCRVDSGSAPEIREDLEYAVMRVGLMKEAAAGIIEDGDPGSTADLVYAKTPGPAEVINYFLMRMADRDYKAAAHLSTMSSEELEKLGLFSGGGIRELMKNRISKQGSRSGIDAFACESVTLGENSYYFSRMTLFVGGSALTGGRKVRSVEKGVDGAVSEFEAAMQLREPEYITTYKLNTPVSEFDPALVPFEAECEVTPVPNGLLYVQYRSSNDHVDTMNYYMDRDVTGACLLTSSGELVLMSREIMKITMMELEVQSSMLLPKISLTGRYKFGSQIFQTFCETPGAVFEDLVERPDDGE